MSQSKIPVCLVLKNLHLTIFFSFFRYLYNILLDPVIIASRPRLLIFCNKQDYPLAKGKQVIKSQLEKEM